MQLGRAFDALLSRRLAKEIHLPDNQVDRIYMAGLLHDVGKIGVPEAVLQKIYFQNAARLIPGIAERLAAQPR